MTETDRKARLSGWARLWVVFAVLSWLAGAVDVGVSFAALEWPSSIAEITPDNIRHLLWFLSPIAVASVWIAIRWVWTGFRPAAENYAVPPMGTREIIRSVFFGLVRAAIGLAFFVLGLGCLWIGMFHVEDDLLTTLSAVMVMVVFKGGWDFLTTRLYDD